ncbi:8859_t:CDS:2 [Gigaspora margarita]|uniref:8859_t:CDS:1 n=1 Tax=Gigaspora margarita TaxID=4874 RepID=A0ABN7VDB3_GIGMA|nr:8859_t:CDS:2 [Gigaspora margarita]
MSNSTWAYYKKESISKKIKAKMNLSILQVLKLTSISMKAWPQEWKTHIYTWIKLASNISATRSVDTSSPSSIKEALEARNIKNKSKQQAAQWLHIQQQLYPTKKLGLNFFGKHTTENNIKNNMNNIKNNENMYSILLQEKGSSTKESWNDIVFQYKSYLQANTSIQKIDNRQNNNKEHVTEFNSERLQHGSTNTEYIMTNMNSYKTNLQVNENQELRESKLEKEKDETVFDYVKPKTYTQSPEKNNDMFLKSTKSESKAININTNNQKEITVNMITNIEHTTPSSTPNSLITEQDIRDELTMDDPFQDKTLRTFLQKYMLKLEHKAKKSSSWKFDKNLMKNELLKNKIEGSNNYKIEQKDNKIKESTSKKLWSNTFIPNNQQSQFTTSK